LRNSAAGGGLHPTSLILSNRLKLRRTAYHQTPADILGSFIIKKLVNKTLFIILKRPNIFNVRAMARLMASYSTYYNIQEIKKVPGGKRVMG
jgi:hypothetical protein